MIGACITTYHESAHRLAEELGRMRFEVFIVDAEATGERRGIAPCLLDAWRMALAAGCDYIVQLDAGGSHNPRDATRLINPLWRGEADMVVGSRFGSGARYIGNPKRALLSRLAALTCNRTQAGAHYSDWTSGYRAFTADAARRLLAQSYRAQMHGWQIEVLARANELGLRVVEVPITYRAGRSSFDRAVAWEAFCVWSRLVRHIGGKRESIRWDVDVPRPVNQSTRVVRAHAGEPSANRLSFRVSFARRRQHGRQRRPHP